MFIQGRINSTRLPNKALLDVKGHEAIYHTLQSMKKVQAGVYVLLTNETSYKALTPIATRCGYDVFVGDDSNVLKRFCDCLQKYEKQDKNITHIIRATGDNLLLSYEYANRELELLSKYPNSDYITITSLPIGTGVELVSAKALKKALQDTTSDYDREHVCPYLYNNPNVFNILKEQASDRHALCKDISVTMDTPDDYQKVLKIFDALYGGDSITIDALCTYLTDNFIK